MTRRIISLPLAVLVVTLAGGCVGIRSDRSAQVGISDTVRISTTICPDGSEGASREDNCLDDDRAEYDPENMLVGQQIMIAYRVPRGTGAPSRIVARAHTADGTDIDEQPLDFDRSDSYAEELEQGDDAGEDFAEYDDGKSDTMWIGYVSEVLDEGTVGDIELAVDMNAPAGADRFEHQTVVGWREAGSDVSPTRAREILENRTRAARERGAQRLVDPCDIIPMLCGGSALTDPSRGVDCDEPNSYGGGTECIDDPDRPEDTDLQLRDLSILPADGFAVQGGTATVPFVLRTAGPTLSDPLATLAATTTLPGAALTVRPETTRTLPTGDEASPVDVRIPDDAAPGAYDVVLTADVAGERREGRGTVVVLANPAISHREASADPRERLYMDEDGNVAFGYRCPPLCGSLKANLLSSKSGIATASAVRKPRLLNVGGTSLKAVDGERIEAEIELFPSARRAVSKGKAVKALLVVRKNGSDDPVIRRVVIRRAAK